MAATIITITINYLMKALRYNFIQNHAPTHLYKILKIQTFLVQQIQIRYLDFLFEMSSLHLF